MSPLSDSPLMLNLLSRFRPVGTGQLAPGSPGLTISSLPPEVLSRVFELYHTLPPTSLALVSRQWAAIVFTTPSLWTHLRITLPHAPRGVEVPGTTAEYALNREAFTTWFHQVEAYGSTLQMWFARSHELPLTIDIRVAPQATPQFLPHENTVTALRPILYPLFEVSDRLKALTGAVTFPSPLFQGFLLSKSTFSALRQIAINIEVDMNDNRGENGNIPNSAVRTIGSCSGTLWGAPRLEVIAVERMPMIQDLPSILPSWTRLTHLGTLIVNEDQLGMILASCKSLVQGSFQRHQNDSTIYPGPQNRSQFVPLPNLRVLTFVNFGTTSLNKVFTYFGDIAVEALSIKNRICTHSQRRGCTTKFYDVILKCASTLKELSLDHACLNHQRLQIYLRALSNLTTLTLEYGPEPDGTSQQARLAQDLSFNEVLAQMMAGSSPTEWPSATVNGDKERQPPLAPKLTTFNLNIPWGGGYSSCAVSQEIATQVLISRTSPHAEVNKVAPLKHFKVSGTLLVPGCFTWARASGSRW